MRKIDSSLNLLEEDLAEIVGQKVVKAKCGVGSMCIIDMGKKVRRKVNTRRGISAFWSGTWTLWMHLAEWSFYKGKEAVCCCEDETREIHIFLQSLVGKAMLGYEILNKALDIRFDFESDLSLTVNWHPDSDGEDDEQWQLLTPDRSFNIWPKGRITIDPADRD